MPKSKTGRHRQKGIRHDYPRAGDCLAWHNVSGEVTGHRKGKVLQPVSMQDVARHTTQRSNASAQPLRHSSINFINSSNEPPSGQPLVETMKPTTTSQDPYSVQSLLEPNLPLTTLPSLSSEYWRQVGENSQSKAPQSAPNDATVKPSDRISQQLDTESEEEVIIFGGRNSHRSTIKPSSTTMKRICSPSFSTEPSPLHGGEISNEDTSEKLSDSSGSGSHLRPEQPDSTRPPFPDKSQSLHHVISNGGYDAAIADYAENAESNGPLMECSPQIPVHQLTSIDVNEGSTNTSLSTSIAEPTTLQCDEVDLVNFRDLSTSDEATGSPSRVILKKERGSTTQYPVVWEGKNVDDASWIPLSQLTSCRAQEATLSYEQTVVVDAITPEQSSTEDSSDIEQLVMKDVARDMQDIVDHDERFNRAVERTTDDEIARMLSKQEELGLGSNKLVLFNNLDFEAVSNTLTSKMGRGGRQSNVVFHERSTPLKFLGSDEAQSMIVADQYGEFDIMDFGRLSLQRKSKGRKDAAPQASDEELNTAIQKSWKNDRAKKKLRKDARDEARLRGLLGKKHGADTRSESQEAITASQIKAEIKSFLLSDDQCLSLRPMDKHLRRLTHEIANRLNLRSKSLGVGHQRFPQLFKTSLTGSYDELSLQDIDRLLARGNRHKQKGPGARKVFAPSRRGGRSASAAVYRDGEVVGAEAPELGLDNKGRAMLEKMGWSKGTALGAFNNKGILQPVSHVVKTTKAGLG